MSDEPKRRWYQFGFSIRDLLLVTVIVALAVGWWVDHGRLAGLSKRWKGGGQEMRLVLNSQAPVPIPPKK